MRSSHRLSKGLFFFPLKTNILNNEKIKILRADHGNEAFSCYIYILCRLYGGDEEYYKKFGPREKKLFCDDEKITRDLLEAALATCFEEDVFDSTIYDKYEILTSENIQLTWVDVTHRRTSITMIKEYVLIDLDIPLCRNRVKIVDLSKKVHQNVVKKQPTSKEKPAKATVLETSSDLMPGVNNYTTEEVKKFCAINYDKQPEKFKKQIDKGFFESYIKFNKLIDNDYLPLRGSNNQVTYAEFVKLTTLPVNGKVPEKNEITEAVKKLTGTGVNLNTSIYHKLLDYVEYVREPKNLNGKNGYNSQPAKTGHKIDHSASAKNF